MSKSLDKAKSERTRLVRDFSAADVERLKVESTQNVRQGLVDEIGIYYVPVVVGGRTAFFRDIQQPLKLEQTFSGSPYAYPHGQLQEGE